ncbi:MAG: PocR ligand-binding domain-containing protein, partial [Bacillota bacterium]
MKISDHFDYDRLNELLEGFNQVTGYVTAIVDLEGNVLSKSGWREVCSDFHRGNKCTAKNCKKSDTILANKMSKGEDYYAYKCLNGLIDVVVPIIIKGEHFANLFTGQFFLKEPSLDFFKQQAEQYDFDEKLYLSVVKKVPVVSETEVKATMKVLIDIIEMISDLTIEKMEQQKLNRLLEKSYEELKVSEEKLREQKEELSVSNEQLTAYNEEVMAMNEELEQSFEEVNLLNQRFVKMIELVSNMEDKTLLSEKDFFADLLESAVEIVPEADYGKICIIDKQDKCKFIDAVGHDIEILEKITFDQDILINKGNKFVNNTKNYFFDIDSVELDKKEIFLEALKPIKDSLYIDIIIDGQTVGRMGLDIKKESSKEFSDTTKKILESFSTIASSFFAFKRFDNLQTNFTKELLTSIIKIMGMYDLYTKGHSENVAKIAAAIATEMKLSKQTIRNTYWSGLVHDIGKLLIPLNIINKKGKLTEQEFGLIKKHPVWGSKALNSSETLKPISKYILHHHERWDGRGYPEGLKENEIPVISQILAVADAWDAMLSKRAYRNSLSSEKALEEIKKNKDSQFAPQVADAFIKIIEENKIEQLEIGVLNNEINNSKKEKNILQKKEEYEELFKKAEEGIVIVDGDFDVIRANNYFFDMFGYNRQQIVGKNIKKVVPEDRIKETDSYIKKIAQGGNINSETIRKKENGEVINVSIYAFPVNLDGGNMGYYIIYRDITELEETKVKYENIKERYKTLFENENTVMLIIDPDTAEIVDANPAAEIFYGWNKNIITSMKISDINVLDKKEVEKEMLNAKAKNRNYFNFKHRTADKKIKDVEVYSQPIPF